MAKKRINVPAKDRALLQQEIESECPICKNTDVGHFEVHHINGNPDDNQLINLLLLCRICHSKITKEDIVYSEVCALKTSLLLKARMKSQREAGKVININGNVNNSTVANTIQAGTIILNRKSKPKIEYAQNSIGADAYKKNYIQHLIDRCLEFRKYTLKEGQEPNHAIIHSEIRSKFKVSVFQIPISQFSDLSDFLKNRINKTLVGKRNIAKKIKNYSSFEDFYPIG